MWGSLKPRRPGSLVRALLPLVSLAALGCQDVSAMPRRDVDFAGVRADALLAESQLVKKVAARLKAQQLDLRIEGERFAFTLGELGFSLDETTFLASLAQAVDPRSTLQQLLRKLGGTGTAKLHPPLNTDAATLATRLQALKDDFDVEPRRARYDWQTQRFEAPRPGRRLHLGASLRAVVAAAREGARSAVARTDSVPALQDDTLVNAASVKTELAYFETRYNPAESARSRTRNLALAAERLQGYVIAPRESFDFNAVVGERSAANGFLPAPVIAAGELEQGLGGGTCQVAGTLHAAAFFAGLPILERHPHSRPSSYIKLGLDAVVAFPRLNLRFRNDYPFPLVIRFTLAKGIARASLHAPRKLRRVELTRHIRSLQAFEETEVEDSSQARGTRRLKQRGIPGFRIDLWRSVHDSLARTTVRRKSESHYPPTPQIWAVGTNDAKPEPSPKPSPPPEYVADEYLFMRHGLGTKDFHEWARAGKTGTYGWMARAGMPSINPNEAAQP